MNDLMARKRQEILDGKI